MCVDQRGSGITDNSLLQDSPHITHSHTDREKEGANERGIADLKRDEKERKTKERAFAIGPRCVFKTMKKKKKHRARRGGGTKIEENKCQRI